MASPVTTITISHQSDKHFPKHFPGCNQLYTPHALCTQLLTICTRGFHRSPGNPVLLQSDRARLPSHSERVGLREVDARAETEGLEPVHNGCPSPSSFSTSSKEHRLATATVRIAVAASLRRWLVEIHRLQNTAARDLAVGAAARLQQPHPPSLVAVSSRVRLTGTPLSSQRSRLGL